MKLTPASYHFRNQGVYLIVGGAKGIGFALSEMLAKQYKARLVWIGRSPVSEHQQKIVEIQALGGEVLYWQADVTDFTAMKDAVDAAKSCFGVIHAAVHSALVLQDKLLTNMNSKDFLEALNPKILGSIVFYENLKQEKLDFMLFFSSLQSFFGNIGQSNYAAGCTFQDAYALFLNAKTCFPVKVINWGYWGNIGIARTPEYLAIMQEKEIYSIEINEGIRAISELLQYPIQQLLVIKSSDTFKEKIGIDQSKEIIINENTLPSVVAVENPEKTSNQLLLTTPSKQKKLITEGYEKDNDDLRDKFERYLKSLNVPQIADIAVIGFSGRFPGANNVEEYWENLVEGKSSITEIPEDRWSIEEYFSEDPDIDNKSYSKWGGYLTGADEFDPYFFNISPTEIEFMDPQQRLFLEECWKTIEMAAYPGDVLSGKRCGVFVGATVGDYPQRIRNSGKSINTQYLLGMSPAILAARIAYYLDLKGPSLAIDTACSSSLVAIHQACQSIWCCESDLALAGGVSISSTADFHIMASKASMLSPEGKCKTFDNSADGFVTGEGVGVVLLKPLAKAIEDKDTIYGVIKASGINQDGKTQGITAPNVKSQTALELEVYKRFEIDPALITYVEAHGTGTKLGDPIEIEALTNAFRTYTDNKQFCAVGSVKTNIGHALMAAGVAGFIKILLCLKYKKIPPSLNFTEENQLIPFKETPFYVNTELKHWETKENKRIAAISSFGFSGTNAHMVIEEAPRSTTSSYSDNKPYYLLTLSAKKENSLTQRIFDLAAWLENQEDAPLLEDICYTLNAGRSHYDWRCALVVNSISQLMDMLTKIKNKQIPAHCLFRSNIKEKEQQHNKAIFKKIINKLIHEIHSETITSNEDYRDTLLALGNFYIDGYNIDWEFFYKNNKKTKIVLPSYPFEKESYWIKYDSLSSRQLTLQPPQNSLLDTSRNALENPVKIEPLTLLPLEHSSFDTNIYTIDGAVKIEINDKILKEKTQIFIKQTIAKILNKTESEIDISKPLQEYGADSIYVMELRKVFSDTFGPLPATLLFDYVTVDALSNYFIGHHRETLVNKFNLMSREMKQHMQVSNHALLPNIQTEMQHHQKPFIKSVTSDIAVVGFSGRFPGANNVEEFWQNMVAGKSSITEIPEDRWSIEDYFSEDPLIDNKSYSKWSGHLEGIDQFDPLFFNISPAEAELMDPQQRLFLEECWKVIEAAGYSAESISGQSCGVFVGAGAGDYIQKIKESGQAMNAQCLMGMNTAILSSRIAYYLNLKGPCVAIDTSCSSSLVAIHQACQSIWSGESELALAGGVSIMTTPDFHIMASKANMLSPEGKCKTFDNAADGFVMGEGVGVVLLKPLSRAIEDKDTIYGVIKGSGINQDGKTQGITAPSVKSQTALELDIYKRFEIDPASISYVEAHGTGTKLGDPIEIEALTNAFKTYTDKKQFCAIGSVKTNIGHTVMAAGIAGFIKVLLCLKYKKIPPSLNFTEENQHISFVETPFYVNTELKNWESKETKENKRVAAVSSFGFSGTNAHVVIEEAPGFVIPSSSNEKPYYLLTLSAKKENILKHRILDLATWLENQEGVPLLEDICYTLNAGRSHFDWRCALVVNSVSDLKETLIKINQNQVDPTKFICAEIQNKLTESSDFENVAQVLKAISNINQLTHEEYRDQLLLLANLYIKGNDISWLELHNNESRRHIFLPTYPFEKKSYWIKSTHSADIKNSAKRISLHPLLDENVSILDNNCFSKKLLREDFYLSDHCIKEIPMLPGVAYLEMAQAAGSAILNKKSINVLSNVVWLNPIQLQNSDSCIAKIHLSASDEKIKFEVTSENTLHAQGFLHSDDRATIPDQEDIFLIKKRCPQERVSDSVYSQFESIGISYGKTFQVIDTLWQGKNESLSKICLPPSLDTTFSEWSLHPSIMDGALQSVISLIDHEQEKMIYLPFAIEKVEIFSPLPKMVYAHVMRDEYSYESRDRHKFNIKLLDENGNILLIFHQVTMRSLTSKSSSNQMRYYRPSWEVYENNTHYEEEHGRILILRSLKEHDDNQFDLLKSYFNNEVKVLTLGDYSTQEACSDLIKNLIENNQIPRYIICYSNKTYDISNGLINTFNPVFFLTKALLQAKVKEHIDFIYCYGYNDNQQKGSAFFEALSGLFKTINQEEPLYTGRLLGVESTIFEDPQRFNEILLKSFSIQGDQRFVDEKFLVKRFKEIVINEDKALHSPFCKNGSYIITGGAGGLGLIIAEYLAKTYQAKLLLAGRSELNLHQIEKIKSLITLGADVHYRHCDVANRENVANLLQFARDNYGTINGIIHIAGCIRDSLIVNKEKSEFIDVFSPKIMGTLNLDELTQHDPLDCFILYSSIASQFGNIGQADYAYANSFIDALAHNREEQRLANQRSGKTITINWPLWKDGGMQVKKEVHDWVETLGMTPLNAEDGVRALTQILATSEVQTVVFSNKKSADYFLSKSSSRRKPKSNLAHLQQEKNEDLLEKINEDILKMVSTLLKIDVEELEITKDISEYGVDSIGIISIMNSINNYYHLTLAPVDLFEYSTVASLAEYILINHKEEIERHYSPSFVQSPIINEKKENEIIEFPPNKENQSHHFDEILLNKTLPEEDHQLITKYVEKLLNPILPVKIYKKLFKTVFHFLFKRYFKLTIKGLENIPRNEPVIICANHTSGLDGIIIDIATYDILKGVVALGAEDVFFNENYKLKYNLFILNFNHIMPLMPFDRTNNDHYSVQKNFKFMEYCKNNNKSMLIFPEGTRSLDGEVNEFKSGIGLFANELNLKIVPAYIEGALQLMPKKTFFPKPGQLTVVFGPAQVPKMIPKNKDTSILDFYKEIAGEIRSNIINLKTELRYNG